MSFASGESTRTPECCKGCVYREVSGISICAFSLRTGKLRGCPPEECTHYKSGQEEQNFGQKGLKGDLKVFDIEAPWIGNPDYEDFEYKEEEYIPEYYPECDADYDY